MMGSPRFAGGTVTRRRLLLSGVATMMTGGVTSFVGARSPVTVGQFLLLSSRLTGRQGLDREIGRSILDGFLATGHGAAVAALVAGGNDHKYAGVAGAIVAAWYSGVGPAADGFALVTFERALVWGAIAFTKPFGVCGGETGYWAAAPED